MLILSSLVLIRGQHHEPTQAYIARRRAEGKTDREIRRCLTCPDEDRHLRRPASVASLGPASGTPSGEHPPYGHVATSDYAVLDMARDRVIVAVSEVQVATSRRPSVK
jgi:hypothetical protein